MNVVIKADKRQMDDSRVRENFSDAFKRVTCLQVNEVNRASVAGLSDSQCRQALLLACKMLHIVSQNLFDEMALTRGFRSVFEQFIEQFVSLEKELKARASVMKDESDAFLRQISKMEVDQQKRTAESVSLAEKAAKDSAALVCELEKLKYRTSKADGEASELRRRLPQADLWAANRHMPENAMNLLEEQLSKWVAYGKDANAKAEDLDEKLRCTICMDRPKDTAFACGHTCCGVSRTRWVIRPSRPWQSLFR